MVAVYQFRCQSVIDLTEINHWKYNGKFSLNFPQLHEGRRGWHSYHTTFCVVSRTHVPCNPGSPVVCMHMRGLRTFSPNPNKMATNSSSSWISHRQGRCLLLCSPFHSSLEHRNREQGKLWNRVHSNTLLALEKKWTFLEWRNNGEFLSFLSLFFGFFL